MWKWFEILEMGFKVDLTEKMGVESRFEGPRGASGVGVLGGSIQEGNRRKARKITCPPA